jgi:5-methyltetrahydrofolate--homocysteine methyltransferase
MEIILNEIAESIIVGNTHRVEDLVQACLVQEIPAERILYDGLIAGMSVVGERFKKDEIYLPEVMMAGRAMHKGMDIVEPILRKSDIKFISTALLGTVKDDFHDIGKKLVSMMLKGAGFRVIDIGIDVSEERFVEAIKENKPDVVGLSALLTATMPRMKTTIEAIDRAGLRKMVKIMVGGAPVTQSFSSEIGADGYAPDAASAVDKAIKLLNLK